MSEQNLGEIIVHQSDDGQTRVDVRFEGDTVWLSLDQLALLFDRDKSTIPRHLKKPLRRENRPRIQLLQISQPLRRNGKPVRQIKPLSAPGSVSHQQPLTNAQAEYRKYQPQPLSPVEQAYPKKVQALEKTPKKKSREKSDRSLCTKSCRQDEKLPLTNILFAF